MPVPYVRFATASSADTLYVVGGLGGDTGVGFCFDDANASSCAPTGVMMSTSGDAAGGNPGRTGWATWAYNVTAGAWRTDAALRAARLNTPRSDSCGAVIGNKLYVVGAPAMRCRDALAMRLLTHAAARIAGGYGDYYNISDALEVLDLSAAVPAWRSLAPLPAPRGDLTCAPSGGLLYVFGGYYDPFCAAPGGCFNTDPSTGGDPRAGAGAFNGVSNFRTETWSYDPAANAWTARASMRYARGDAAAVALPGGRIVVGGGEHNLRTTDVKVPQHSVELYDASHDTWEEKAPMPFARFRFAAAAVGQTSYMFGGQGVCSDDPAMALTPCQLTAAATHSVFFELDHPGVFVQLPAGVDPPLTYDDALADAIYDTFEAPNVTGAAAAGRHRRAAMRGGAGVRERPLAVSFGFGRRGAASVG